MVHGAAYGPGGEGTLRVSFASGGDDAGRGLELPARRPRSRYEPATSAPSRPHAQLERARDIEGEVRFDKVSRALYSTDASVYQIEPLGVVVPRSREDIIRVVRDLRQLSLSAHHARRRHVAGRPGHRRRAVRSTRRSTSTGSSS